MFRALSTSLSKGASEISNDSAFDVVIDRPLAMIVSFLKVGWTEEHLLF
jgi:hypothetical protein